MKVVIPDKKLFLYNFLQPIAKISDSCVVKLNDSALSCLTCTPDSSVILYAQYNLANDYDTQIILNIPDLKKLIKAFECISTDSFSLTLDKNNLTYLGTEIKLKYHLLEDGIITTPKLNLEKMNQLDFPITFVLPYKVLLDLIRGSTFATESNKLYLYSENGKIYGDLTDRARHNVDSFSIPICDYNGPELQNLCLNFEVIRIISGVRVKQLECKVNPKLGVIMFQITDNKTITKYLASSLVK